MIGSSMLVACDPVVAGAGATGLPPIRLLTLCRILFQGFHQVRQFSQREPGTVILSP